MGQDKIRLLKDGIRATIIDSVVDCITFASSTDRGTMLTHKY